MKTWVQEGPEQGCENWCAWGQNANEGRLEDLVSIEGEIPEEPTAASGKQPVPVPAKPNTILELYHLGFAFVHPTT